jgi:NADPH2:quinone reductase
MKAIQIEALGGPEVMQVVDVPVPEPGPKQVRVKVEAVGLNYSDIMIREGKYLSRTQLPQIMGREFAGVIDSVGDAVRGFQPGQRVYGTINSGALAEYALCHAAALLPLPDGLSSEMAVALIVQGVTALHCLDDHGGLKPGETVLIHAAAGGVGTLAIQMAKQLGAGKIIGTASSDTKCNTILELGAEAVNYSSPDWVEEVLRLTDGRGADLILESVGGDVFWRSYRDLLAFAGRIVVVGIASGEINEVRTNEILRRNKTIIGYFLAEYFEKAPEKVLPAIMRVLEMVNSGAVKPVIGATFPLEQAVDAFNFMQNRQNIGKVVIKP